MQYVNDVYNSGGKIKRALIRAMAITQKHPNYSFDRMKVALKSKGSKLLSATSREDYIGQFETMLNGGLSRKSKNRIRLVEFFKNREFEEEEEAA
jgi:hypothetical protein